MVDEADGDARGSEGGGAGGEVNRTIRAAEALDAGPARTEHRTNRRWVVAMNSVVLARTASGSTYVLSMGPDGVHWCRLPAERRAMPWTASGWEASMPRIVPGERLLIGNLRTTPITTVSVLPA